MTRTRAVRATGLATAALAATLLAGTATAVAAPASSHHRATVVVHATAKHKVLVPASTRPGMARITNTGKQPVFLVTPRHGAGRATLARELNAETGRGLLRDFLVADAVPVKATTYLRLARGTYYLADISREHFTAASIATLRVTGTKVDATVPKAKAVVVSSRNTLTSPTTIGTTSELRIRNAGTHLQELFLAPVQSTVTTAQLNAFLAKPSFDSLFSVVSPDTLFSNFLAILSPRGRATSSHHTGAGRYVLVTLAVTSSGSLPKLAAGQVRLVTVK